MPPNTTSLEQAMDMGIIKRPANLIYHVKFVNYILEAI
jgi:hypothetical protein